MSAKMKLVPFEKLVDGFNVENNVRDPKSYDYSKGEDKRLLEDIQENGLIDRLEVYTLDNGELRGLKGFRRFGAITNLFDHDRSVFESHFGSGVQCLIHSDLTEEQAVNIMCDHGVKKLDPVGRHRVIRRYLNLGWSQPQIMKRTGYSRGVVQLSDMLSKLPEKWEEARIAEWRGDEDSVHITDLDIRSAYNARTNASEDKEGGVCSLDHCKGETEEAIWDTLGKGEKPKGLKVRSKSDIKAMIERVRKSNKVRNALRWAAGEEVDLIGENDYDDAPVS